MTLQSIRLRRSTQMKYATNWQLSQIRVDEDLSDKEQAVVKVLVQRVYREYTGRNHAPPIPQP